MGNSDYENARQMNLAAGACLKKGDFRGALENFSRALELLPADELEAKARLHSNIGHVQVNLQRYDDALSSFRNAGKIFRQLGDKIGQGEQFGNIGSIGTWKSGPPRWTAILGPWRSFRKLVIGPG